MVVYEIAKNWAEAEDLANNGFGYESQQEAQDALDTDDKIDDYRRSLLKVFKVYI